MGYPFLKFKYLSSSPSFWVTLSLLTVLIPHFERLPLWMTGIIVGAFIWRLLAIKDNHYLPKKWLVFIITLSTCVATFLHYGTLLGKTAGTAFLSILLAIKLLESHSKRDYMLILAQTPFVTTLIPSARSETSQDSA